MRDAASAPAPPALRSYPGARNLGVDRPSPGEPRGIGYLYILPALIVYALFVLLPFGHSVLLSFYEWDGITPGTFIGVQNYAELLTDPATRSAFGHSLVLILFYSALPVLIGLLLAAAISRTQVRGLAWFRTILFLPQIVPLVVVAVMWRSIYAPATGPLNEGLRFIGLDSWARPWLGDFTWALPSVGLVGTWVQYGLCMVLFIAGVQKIPTSLYDAARVDGAGPLNEFLAVTLPNLRNEIAVALTLTIIASLRNFDLVYLTTNGGPGNATSVPAFEVYNRAFEINQVGSAAAIGVALAVIIFAITFLVNRLAEGDRP
ncbi:MAG: sugar ABC transporter permease [Actinobacteria bacterium]|nr:sugar ABC transporter permease [Actinomycetota bacterium]